jgi:hypothetical protein
VICDSRTGKGRRDRRPILPRRAILAGLPVLMLGLDATVKAADNAPQPIALSQQDRADLRRIVTYLNSITTTYARFK